MNDNIFRLPGSVEPVKKNNEEDIPEFSKEGYQVVHGEFFSHLFEPSVSFKRGSVAVNAACIRRLSDVDYVQFLVHPLHKKLAIRSCTEDAQDSFKWCTISENGKRKAKTITCPIFFAKVMDLMKWDPSCRYRMIGKIHKSGSDTVFVFDLNSAEVFNSGKSRTPHYTDDWKDQFGIPVNEHDSTVQISIFDDDAVFRIERNTGQKERSVNDEESTAPDNEQDTSAGE